MIKFPTILYPQQEYANKLLLSDKDKSFIAGRRVSGYTNLSGLRLMFNEQPDHHLSSKALSGATINPQEQKKK